MRPLLFTALAFALATGCAAGGDDGLDNGGVAGSSGTAGSAPNPDVPSSLSIESIGEIGARAKVEVIVQADPPGIYRVRFSLPSDGFTPGDAALDTSEMDTDAAGRAVALLTASSAPAEFVVRASVGNVIAIQDVSVTGPGRATIRVKPVTLGHRTPTTWTATVHQRKTCAMVMGMPPDDGELDGLSSSQSAPVVTDVETGVPLAVTLRSDYFMGGCQTVDMLPPEATKTPRVVSVNVLDRPIELAESSLSLSLGLSDTGAWDNVLSRASSSMLSGLHGSASVSDVDALLDAMQASLPVGPPQQSFLNARLTENWDAVVTKKWASATKMTDLVSGWLGAGKAKLSAGDRVLVGFLAATGGKKANYALETVAGVPAGDAGFSKDAQVTWSATPDDTVVLSTFVYFSSSRLLASLAEPAILSAHDGAASVAAALSTELSCADVGQALAAAGSDSELAYAGCDGACLSALCSSGLAAIWQRARDAAAPIQLGIAATGLGFVGDKAQLSGMNGSWVGKLVDGDDELPTGGSLTGAQPPLSTP